MPAKILDGKALAARLQAEMVAQVQAWIPQVGRPPGLAVLRVGEDPASAAYVRGKERACERLGIASFPMLTLFQPLQMLQGRLRLAGL